MRFSLASAALAAAFVLTPVASGYAPAMSQDFSITNKAEPVDPSRRDLMRELQAWWDKHAFYPKEAAQADVGGTVKVHLVIHPDGNIFMVRVAESSGSHSLDRAGFQAFRSGFVRPFSEGANAQQVELDISLHYVLAHRHDEPVPAGYKPMSSNRAFTISNDQVQPSVVDTLLQRTCTGIAVKDGIRNHPIYGRRIGVTAIFFRKPDGTSWVKFSGDGIVNITLVTEIGGQAQWTTGPIRPSNKYTEYAHYSVWPDSDNHLTGDIDHPRGTVDLTCATEVVPAISSIGVVESPAQPVYPPEPEGVIYLTGYTPPANRSP